jgi:hypothetical protein
MLTSPPHDHRRFFTWSLLALLLPLVILIPALTGFPYPSSEARYSDLTITHYPYTLFLRQSLLAGGRLPLWSPNLLSGVPFAANPLAGVWYPPGWLALILPLPLGFNLLVAAHLFWGALGMYGLLRAEGLSAPAALFGGLAFASLPKLFAHYGAGHLTLLYALPWTPWLLWAARRDFLGQSARMRFPLQGLAFAFILLADVRWAAYAACLWWGYSLAYTSWAGWPRRLLQLLGQSLLGLLIAAPLLFPLAELAPLSSRSAMTAQDALVFSLPPERLLGLFFPDFGGFHEYMLYAGQAILALCLLVLIRALRHPAARFWVWTALIALLLALGSYFPPLALLAQVPGLDLLRVPARWLFVAGIAMSAAAACAVDVLMAINPGRRQRLANLALTALVGFSLVLTAGVWVVGGRASPHFVWGTLFLLASTVWISLRLNRRLPARIWLAGLFAITLVDLMGVNRTLFAPRTVEVVLSEGRQVVAYLSGQAGEFRVYSPSYSLPQQTAAAAGLQLADGVEPLQLAPYVAYMKQASGVPFQGYSITVPPFETGDPSTANADYRPDAALLGRLNVRYVAAEFDLPVEGLKLEEQFGDTRLYRNLLEKPRAWLEPAGADNTRPAPIPELLAWNPDRIEVRAQGPGTLVLSEIAYPGWRVWVDGVSQPVESFDGLLRSVQLSAGDHLVVFAFRPVSLALGWVGFALGAACLVITAWIGRRSRRVTQTPVEAT